MKQLTRSFSVFLIVLFLSAGMVPKVSAAYGSVIFRGKNEKFSMEPGSGYSATDLFSGFKNVMPGDVLTETITVRNHSWDGDFIKLYLRMEPHSVQNPISYSERFEQLDGKDQAGISGYRDESLNTMKDFLSKLNLRIYNGNTLIFDGSADEAGNLAENIYLGSLRRYRSLDLKLELEVPVELDNRYADRVGEVDWIFTAEVFEDPGKPDIPKTGDGIFAAAEVMMLSAVLLAMLLVTRRRRK